MEFRILGPLEVVRDGGVLPPPPNKPRALLALLVLHRGDAVTLDRLADELWGEQPPANAAKGIQVYVSQLRKALGEGVLETRGRGYALVLEPEQIDAVRFERMVAEGAEHVAAGRAKEAAAILSDALALWRGPPLADFAYEPWARAEIDRLEDLRLAALEERIEAELALGRHGTLIAELQGLVEGHPTRERLCAQLMLALYRSGRQTEALDVYRARRRRMLDELGIEPSPALRALEAAVLRQDPDLEAPARDPSPLLRRRRRGGLFVAVGGAALLIAAIAAGAATLMAGGGGLNEFAENAVGQIDRDDGELVGEYVIGREPRALAAGRGAIWVADPTDGTVSRLDPGEKRVVTIPVGSDPTAVAFGEGAVWVAERGDGTVAQISPASNKVTRRIEGLNAPDAIASGFGSVWVASAVNKTVVRVAPDGSRHVVRLDVPSTALAIGAGAVWVSSEETGTVFRVEPRTGSVVRAIPVGNRPVAIAAGRSGVWVVNRQDATVSRIDPATNSVSDTVAVARDPAAVAIAGGDVWVATADARVSRIDPRTGRVAGDVELGSPATALVADGRSVWVATQPTAGRHRGGTVTVAAGEYIFPYLEAGTYDSQAQQILTLAYDGLVAYRRTGGTTFGPLVANLAVDVPEPSPDGRTYVFTLRRGIRFSDGTAVAPDDFRASLEDVLRRRGRHLPPFFDAIVGARACVETPQRCDLSSGIVTDARERTITVRLTRPDRYLLNKLATPFALVAPAKQPFRPDREPPGTGPYRVADFDPRRGAELTRNPHFRVWSQDARPDGLPDKIVFRVGDAEREVAAVQRGDIDVVAVADAFGTSLPREAMEALYARHPERLHASATPSLFYLWMNVRERPFDDVRVRRAVNYALDRELIAELEGSDPLVLPACHHVAPGHPGYAPVCEYTRNPHRGIWSAPDLERAQALIARSRTAGQRVTVSVPTEDVPVGRYVARLLARLGYRTDVRALGPYGDFHDHVADSRNGAQIGVDGWAADFPSPADFTTPFTCANYRPRSIENANLAQYCDRGFEERIEAALDARGGEAEALWNETYRYLARAAPAAPLVNRRGAVFVSERLANYQHHPLFGVLLDQVWVR